MPNAFSKDYQPVVDLTQDSIKNEMSRKRSLMRKDKLNSDDPAVRKMAASTLGRLSFVRENKAILKNSKLG
jgi:hypothetical protein